MERPANPFYVDTRRRFAASATEQSQTSDPNKQVLTQNPTGATQFTAPKYVAEPAASGVKSSNQAGRPPKNAYSIDQGDQMPQVEEWETRVQLGLDKGKMFWNIDGMKPKERLIYFEKIVV